MQSWMALLVAGILLSPVVGSTPAEAETSVVPTEVSAAVDAARAEWQDSLGARRACSAGVTIVYAEIEGRRGEYRTRTGEVVIDPTDSRSGLGALVIHELSHHTFLACGAFADAEFTEAFYAAQDLPEDRDWFDYAIGWSATPAEHFAEAMAITISGSGEGGISVGSETTSVISRWLAGAPSTPPADSYQPVPYSAGTDSSETSDIDVESGQPSVVPQPTASTTVSASPAAAVQPAPVVPVARVLRTVDIFGEVFEYLPTSAIVFWLNAWRVVGPF